jgi:hypothetical protein
MSHLRGPLIFAKINRELCYAVYPLSTRYPTVWRGGDPRRYAVYVGQLTFSCPKTGRPIKTGIEMDAYKRRSTWNQPVRVSCGAGRIRRDSECCRCRSRTSRQRLRDPCQLSFAGVPAMTEIDWPAVGSALLLVCWFGFLCLLLYLHAFSATMPP